MSIRRLLCSSGTTSSVAQSTQLALGASTSPPTVSTLHQIGTRFGTDSSKNCFLDVPTFLATRSVRKTRASCKRGKSYLVSSGMLRTTSGLSLATRRDFSRWMWQPCGMTFRMAKTSAGATALSSPGISGYISRWREVVEASSSLQLEHNREMV